MTIYNKLTPRQREVALYISYGYSDKRIAEEMGIVASTVHSHLERIYRRLNLHTRHELATTVIREGNTICSPIINELSVKQLEICRSLMQGSSVAAIAQTRHCSPSNVYHLRNTAFKTLGVRSVTELTALYGEDAFGPNWRVG